MSLMKSYLPRSCALGFARHIARFRRAPQRPSLVLEFEGNNIAVLFDPDVDVERRDRK